MFRNSGVHSIEDNWTISRSKALVIQQNTTVQTGRSFCCYGELIWGNESVEEKEGPAQMRKEWEENQDWKKEIDRYCVCI